MFEGSKSLVMRNDIIRNDPSWKKSYLLTGKLTWSNILNTGHERREGLNENSYLLVTITTNHFRRTTTSRNNNKAARVVDP